MAGSHGGYRAPSKPAAVSGPGANSRRTDGGVADKMALPNAAYGEAKAFSEIQSGAPLGASAPQGPQAPPGDPFAGVTPLGAPSAQPDVPVTDGASAGPGAGLEALGLGQTPDRRDADHYAQYMGTLMRLANADSTPPGTKEWIRNIIASRS